MTSISIETFEPILNNLQTRFTVYRPELYNLQTGFDNNKKYGLIAWAIYEQGGKKFESIFLRSR